MMNPKVKSCKGISRVVDDFLFADLPYLINDKDDLTAEEKIKILLALVLYGQEQLEIIIDKTINQYKYG